MIKWIAFVTLIMLTRAVEAQSDSCCNNEILSNASKVEIITYNFKTREISDMDKIKLKRGQAIKIRVLNLNPFIYKAVINGTDSSYRAVVDAGNLLSAFGTLSNLTQLVAGIANNVTTSPIKSRSYNENNQDSAVGNAGLSRFAKETSINNDGKTAEPLLKKQRKNLFDLFSQQKETIDSINSRIIHLKKLIDSTGYEWQRKISAERTPFPSCNEFSKLTDGKLISTIKRDFENILEEDNSILSTITTGQRDYLQNITACQDLLSKTGASPYRAQDSLFRDFYIQALLSLNKVDSTLSYKNIETITESLESIQGLSLCYTSPPLFLIGDSKIITLQIKPWRDTMPYITDPPITFEVPWNQKHIWGVSAGIYGSFLHNNQYSTKTTVSPIGAATDTAYSLQKDNAGSGEFGVNAIAYEGWRIKESSWYGGFCFGAGLSIESKPKPRIFLGGSFINGDKNRIALSAGAVAGFVDELSSVYKNNLSNLQINPVNATHSVMKINFFISVNYSFLGN